MIDHLINFSDEVTAQADPVVGKYYTPASDDGPGGWRGDCCIAGVSVYSVTGTTTVTDPDTGATYQQEIRRPFPGWFIDIALGALDPALRALPGCILIADRDKAAVNDPTFLLYTQPGITQDELNAAHVEPTFAGSKYPFGDAP